VGVARPRQDAPEWDDHRSQDDHKEKPVPNTKSTRHQPSFTGFRASLWTKYAASQSAHLRLNINFDG
jgi:hypothetical protein